MKYKHVSNGRFVRRVNRFIAEVTRDGSNELVHVKNTGRLKELLLPGVEVLLEKSNNPNRKTTYSLIAVKKRDEWVNIDSQAPNETVMAAFKSGKLLEFGHLNILKREVTYQSSRFDFYYENDDEKGFIEVKGVTLEENGVAMFPDAPTIRGTKHLLELIEARRAGYAATVLFVVQMKGCHAFMPNRVMDPAFSEALAEAVQAGVRIMAYDAIVKEDELEIDVPLTVKFYND